MPDTACGFAASNALTIPTIDTFALGPEDVQVTKHTGPQEIRVKTGTLIDTINSVKIIALVTLYHIERDVYDAIKAYAVTDLQSYLASFSGSITLDLGGETITNGVIKSVRATGGSVFYPPETELDTETEYINTIEIEIHAVTFNWI